MFREDMIQWIEDELSWIPNDETYAWMKDAAALATCFFCAAYHDMIKKQTFDWAIGELFGKEKNTRHDLHMVAIVVLAELGHNARIESLPKKDPGELGIYEVTVKEIRIGTGYVLANDIEDARNFGNFAAMKGQLTMEKLKTRNCVAQRVNDKKALPEGAFFDIVKNPYGCLEKPWREMK